MRKHLLGLMMIAGVAGCTSEPGVESVSPGAESPAQSKAESPAPTASSLALARGAASGFAALPDRGELVAYGGARKTRSSGPYTWHPVSVSETHALNAIGSGRLVINTPEGKPLALRYDRHEEHADGNWTWFGRNSDGASAVMTFGEKAVFGTIVHGDTRYRLRSDRTGAWLVETDPRLVAANGGRPHDGDDTLLPPASRALAAAAARQLGKSGAAAQTSFNKAGAVVDLLVGYSSTIATELGSQNAAVTLMSNLAAMTNAAYADSGVNMRVRLVHVMPVNYSDNSLNRDALQQLTGYNVDTQQPVTPNAAFNSLRAARNEYGADLVAFVRRYREPEQDGCGIAWLLGMNQSGISAADEAFGYAVVSDGEDPSTDNNTYFCSDYSLAHELGHLMGQAHDRDNAADAGAHSYSYGYREASTSGFFTIMAYPVGDGQVEAPYFANPAVRWQNRPTGTATEDNVRSMNQTMPLVSQFRATVVPLPNIRSDFDGDGKSDIIFRHAGNGQNVIWKSANGSTQQAMTAVPSQAWAIVGTGDFSGDGKADVLWRNSASGANAIWRSGSGASADSQVVAAVPDQNWKVAGVGDFNGDNRADILWRHAANGRNVIWVSGNSAAQIPVATVVGGGWLVAGVGDFNGDGRDDILWRSASNGQNTIWRSGASNARQTVATVSDQNWKVAGVGDFDGDGVDDILWRHAVTGGNSIWLGGSAGTQQAVVSVAREWFVAAVGDYDGDGRADVLWRNSSNGSNIYWKSANYSTRQAVAAVPNLAWRVYY
ncbi:FG-GAP-like repeat-containing protein [uncultured Luteimonas sp.]|uniref:FG-GAP-like repeat-containing protein n=1 Tax=uncultured Luteimonas sp. TaxID=453144 RepID=UPI0026243BAB|nr:FG-GAP-like repeat-containing protein [uncultured Luteimonas sp.]